MKLAVVLDQPFWYDGFTYSTNAPFIDFVLSFAARVDELILIAPVSNSSKERGRYLVRMGENVSVIWLPFFQAASEMYMNAHHLVRHIYRVFKENLARWDVAWLVGTHFPNLLFQWVARRTGKLVFYYIRSNINQEIRSHHSNGSRQLGGLLTFGLMEYLVRRKIRSGTAAFVMGNELLSRYSGSTHSHVYKVYPTLICENHIIDTIQESRLADKPMTIITVGRLTPEKGLDVLIEALSILDKMHDIMPVNCRIVGAGKDEDILKKMVSAKGLSDQVSFEGFIPFGDELFSVYDSSDLYVIPSRTEGIPKTLYEAMARGLPIVASNVGGMPEIVEDGVNGIIVPPNDSVSLAKAIRQLAQDSNLRRRFQINNIQKVREFTIFEQRDRMFKMICSLNESKTH